MASVSAVFFQPWFSEPSVIDTSAGSKYWIWFELQAVLTSANFAKFLEPEK
jgi:hypothetical protein